MNARLKGAKRLVVKIGSALLVDNETGNIRDGWLDALASDISWCRKNGQEILVVSSGSIALGRHQLGLSTDRNLRLE